MPEDRIEAARRLREEAARVLHEERGVRFSRVTRDALAVQEAQMRKESRHTFANTLSALVRAWDAEGGVPEVPSLPTPAAEHVEEVQEGG